MKAKINALFMEKKIWLKKKRNACMKDLFKLL